MCVTIFRPRAVSVLYCLSQVGLSQLKMQTHTSSAIQLISLSLFLFFSHIQYLIVNDI